MDRVLVTGSSGFIGSNLCRRLSQEGYEIQGIDLTPPNFDFPDTVETQVGDLTESPELPHADVIIHLAAHSQVQPIVDKTELAIENIEMTRHVLKEAKRMDAFVINASSRDVYGKSITPSEDEITPDSPNTYAASKLSSEAIANAYSQTTDVSVTSFRLANVYGPLETNQRVIPMFISLASKGNRLAVYGEEKLLDFVHVNDVCDAIHTAICREKIVSGEAINIGSGTGTPLIEVAEFIREAIESCPGWNVEPDRSGDVVQYVSDISKAQNILSYKPAVSLDQGLTKTIKWYQNHPNIRERIISDRSCERDC